MPRFVSANIATLHHAFQSVKPEKLYATPLNILVQEHSWHGHIWKVIFDLVAVVTKSRRLEETLLEKTLCKTYRSALRVFQHNQNQIYTYIDSFSRDSRQNLLRHKIKSFKIKRKIKEVKNLFSTCSVEDVEMVFSRIRSMTALDDDTSFRTIRSMQKALDDYEIFSVIGSAPDRNRNAQLSPSGDEEGSRISTQRIHEEAQTLTKAHTIRPGDIIDGVKQSYTVDEAILSLYKYYHYLKAGIIPDNVHGLEHMYHIGLALPTSLREKKEEALLDILERNDPHYLHWIRGLGVGDVIAHNGNRYVLAPALEEEHLEGAYKTFTAESDSNVVIGLYCHQSLGSLFHAIELRKRLPNWQRSMVPEVKIIGSHMVLVERCGKLLKNSTWEGREFGHTIRDYYKLNGIAALTRLFIDKNVMCRNVVEEGRISEKGEIQFQNFKVMEFCPLEMERILYTLSNGDREIFATLMMTSKLSDFPTKSHSIRELYYAAFQAAIDAKPFDCKKEIAVLLGQHVNISLEEDLPLFISRVGKLKENIKKEMTETALFSDDFQGDSLVEDIDLYMRVKYRRSWGISILPPHIKEDVIQSILMTNCPSIRREDGR